LKLSSASRPHLGLSAADSNPASFVTWDVYLIPNTWDVDFAHMISHIVSRMISRIVMCNQTRKFSLTQSSIATVCLSRGAEGTFMVPQQRGFDKRKTGHLRARHIVL